MEKCVIEWDRMDEEMTSVSAVNNLRAAEFISFNPPNHAVPLSPFARWGDDGSERLGHWS